MLGRLLRSADFETVLAVPPRSRSAHFAVHHVAARPAVSASSRVRAGSAQLTHPPSTKLSTGLPPETAVPVDDRPQVVTSVPDAAPQGWWLGLVIPKRHAKRAVTRNLLKRQVRAVFQEQLRATGDLPPGLWVVRLRAGFDPRQWPSAASDALRIAARGELRRLLHMAAQPQAGASSRANRASRVSGVDAGRQASAS